MASELVDLSGGSITILKVGRLHRCDRLPAKYRNAKESGVWAFGDTFESSERPAIPRAWKCHQCKEVCLLTDGKASNAVRHMRKKHRVDISINEPLSSQFGYKINLYLINV